MSDVMVNEHRVAVGVDDDEAGGAAGRFIGARRGLDTLLAQAALQPARRCNKMDGLPSLPPQGVEHACQSLFRAALVVTLHS